MDRDVASGSLRPGPGRGMIMIIIEPCYWHLRGSAARGPPGHSASLTA
jgi:hypothetical protein